MTIYLYLFLGIIFLLATIGLIHWQILYLINNPNQYDKNHNGHELFLTMTLATLRYFFRRTESYFKFIWQYIFHLWVKFLSLISSLFDKIYTLSRNKFVHTAVANKGTVHHFWDNLKIYRREINEEKAKIEDNSLNSFSK